MDTNNNQGKGGIFQEVIPVLLPTEYVQGMKRPRILMFIEDYYSHRKGELTHNYNAMAPQQLQHLYIVDEKLPENVGDWFIDNHMRLCKCNSIENPDTRMDGQRRIVATTDPMLIADGVLSISEEFLKEFVSFNGKGKIMMKVQCCGMLANVADCCKHYVPFLPKEGNAILSIVTEEGCSVCGGAICGDTKKVDPIAEVAKPEFTQGQNGLLQEVMPVYLPMDVEYAPDIPAYLYLLDKKAPIKKGDWYYDVFYKNVYISPGFAQPNFLEGKEIIKVAAATNPKLIADGVLPISKQFYNEEFLEQFVNCDGKGKVMMEMVVDSLNDEEWEEFKKENKGAIPVPIKRVPKRDQSGNAVLSIVPDEKVTGFSVSDLAKQSVSILEKEFEKIDNLADTMNELTLEKVNPMEAAAEKYAPYTNREPWAQRQEDFKAGWVANPNQYTEQSLSSKKIPDNREGQ